MHVYLASSYSRRKEMQSYASDLRLLGHTITSRWLYIDGDAIDHKYNEEGFITKENIWSARRYAAGDAVDVMRSDTVIVFPNDPHTRASNRGGMHFETGLAWALKKRLIIIGVRQNIFHCLEEFEFHENWKAFLATLSAPGTYPVDAHLFRVDSTPIDGSLLENYRQADLLSLDRLPDVQR